MKKTVLFVVMLLTSSKFFGQSIPQDLLTSDPSWNSQVQMMINQYGVAKTREIINKSRTQQQVQQQQNYRNSTLNNAERIISGVFVHQNQLAVIKLRYFSGKITHFSTSRDITGKEQWQTTMPDNPHPTIETVDGRIAREYKYKATVQRTTVYFNL